MMFNPRMRLLAVLFLIGLAAVYVSAQSTPPVDRNVVLKISVANDQPEFRIGETIPLQLSFTSPLKDRYQMNMAQYDRSGRMNYEQFIVTPSEGAVDPLPTYTGSLGGLTTFNSLGTNPSTIKINLNEWVRFTQPGEYRLVVSSNRIGIWDRSSLSGTSPIRARSNAIKLKIIAPDPGWQKRVFKEAVANLNARPPLNPNQISQYETSRKQAIETLRFLGTPDAAREMAKRMREDGTGLEYVCMLGLISSPERSTARAALEEALADPDHPVDGSLLYALRMVSSNNNATNLDWREAQQRVIEQLLAALPSKRGEALSISLNTAISQGWDLNAVSKETTEKLTTQLLSMFDQLPLNEQNTLLSFRWEKIKSNALLPILKRHAEAYVDFPEMAGEPAYESLQLSGNALQRWYELDPGGARSAIITEISRPRPRFDARVLGLLPDKALPDLDFALAEHFAASTDSDGRSHLASLIARYATDAILPQIIEQLDPNIGKWECLVQNSILAYVLRVSPVTARSRIEKAIATRGEGFTACNHDLFQIISEIHNDPVLEEIAVKSLDDPDPEVAMAAANMLGKFGSPAAESALRERYASWSAQWRGRESDLNIPFTAGNEEINNQRGLGLSLTQALATGKGWILDKVELRRLSQLNKVRSIQHQLDSYIKMSEAQPLTIIVDPSVFGFHARVAQYEFQSIDALKEKLARFPSGTTFVLSFSADESSVKQTIAELRDFLTSHGMNVAGEKRDN